MKPNILLVAQGAGTSTSLIERAALETGHGLRQAATSHEAFEILAEDAGSIDVVIVEVDCVDSLCVVDAFSFHKAAPPIVVVTGLEEANMAPTAYRHGATACIGKPFTALELAALIKDVCLPEWQQSGGACDQWGHPRRDRRRRLVGHSHERLHCLSA